jgi:pyruvate-ferredoxin/flavodoxin oxidoreductase
MDYKGNEYKGQKYTIQVAPEDCTGCSICVNVCPAKDKANPEHKAINMVPLTPLRELEAENYEFFLTLPEADRATAKLDVKGSQFLQPLFEYSGACAGCGETPYIKLVTQLFGDHMLIANATGCTSIYTGSSPAMPYCRDASGHGPAWANSLFEDNAEFGYGMLLAYNQRRSRLTDIITKILELKTTAKLTGVLKLWNAHKRDYEITKQAKENILSALPEAKKAAKDKKELIALLDEMEKLGDMIVKKSLWIIGGDGWAYDIGYGGLDHVLSQNEDVNVLVLDTEVYSNTGGQASKATPTGSTAKFAAAGKRIKKKDLGMMAMSYGYVYTAQVGLGANMQQTVKALVEAESYDGPSLLIAYAPCINHGINMSKSQEEIKKAVDCGYWANYRYNPGASAGVNPFTLDSKPPQGDYQVYLQGETRYSALALSMPDVAKVLFAQNEKDAKERITRYTKLSKSD